MLKIDLIVAVCLAVFTAVTFCGSTGFAASLQSNHFQFEVSDWGKVMVLRRTGDAFDTNYVVIDENAWLGDVNIKYIDGGDPAKLWRPANARKARSVVESDGLITVDYGRLGSAPVKLWQTFQLEGEDGDAIVWTIHIENCGENVITIGDLVMPLPFNHQWVKDTLITYQERVVRHSFIAGDGSFIYWCRPNGVGPYLVMTTGDGTHLEYYDCPGPYRVYIYSAATGPTVEGEWPMPHTSVVIPSGERAEYTFRFTWVDDFQGVRDALYESGLIDVHVAPGMTIPMDLSVNLALRTQKTVNNVASNRPSADVEYVGTRDQDVHIYKIRFHEVGEYVVEVNYGDSEILYLEFFSTLPIEELLKSRAGFIKANQQYRGSKWYDGLFSQWDMLTKQMTYPGNTLGLPAYCVGGADDPGLCKAPLLAQINLAYPDESQIEAIEYYIEHFLWGGLQRTDDEFPYPCGLYGSDYWIDNRNSKTGYGSGGHGRERMWRTFDYTHVIQLYYNMYKIARLYPDKVHYLDAEGYLRRAYLTAKAFYEVPYSIYMRGWDHTGYCDWAFKQGHLHEINIPWLIEDLYEEGYTEWADELKGYWENKVKYMVCDHPYPFGSEMYFDTTAFEATHVVAKYGLENEVPPDTRGFYDKNYYAPGVGEWLSHEKIERPDFEVFMERQLIANLAARGVIEPAYYLLGADIRAGGNTNYMLNYMTQLGGWSILDYALYYADDPIDHIRLGYAAYLGPFALINTGEEYPWWPDAQNKGAAAWAFNPEKYGPQWIGSAFTSPRGPWRFDGEIDNGFSGAVRTAATIVVDDSLFGLMAYGGEIDGSAVVPRDGVRQRLHVLTAEPALHMFLDRDGFVRVTFGDGRSAVNEQVDEASGFSKQLDLITIALENRTGDSHTTTLSVRGLPEGKYAVLIDDERQGEIDVAGESTSIELAVGANPVTQVQLARI